MNKIIFLSASLISLSSFANEYKNIDCSSIEGVAKGCNECFDGGSLDSNKGRVGLFNVFKNMTDNKIIILDKENDTPVLFNTFGNGYNWTYSKNPLFKFTVVFNKPSESLEKKYPVLNKSTFFTFQPNSSEKYISTEVNDGVFVEKIGESTKPSGMVIRYILNYRTLIEPILGDVKHYESCVVINSK